MLKKTFKEFLMKAGLFVIVRTGFQYISAYFGLKHERDFNMFLKSPLSLRIADIGANTGQSMVALRKLFPNSIIDCFEPNPACAALLKNIKKIAGGEINIFNVGLGSVAGELGFFTPVLRNGVELLQEGSFDHTQFAAEATIRRIGRDYELKSRTITVETLDERTTDYDLIKIDVQGLEYQVLCGGMQTIRRCKPIMLIERDDRAKCLIDKHLNSLGYLSKNGILNDLYWHPSNSKVLSVINFEVDDRV